MSSVVTARKRDGMVKATAILIVAVLVGVLVGQVLPWLRDRLVVNAVQAQALPPATEVTPPLDDHRTPADEPKPQPVVSRPQPGADIIDSIGMKFKRIPSGTFNMPALQGYVPLKALADSPNPMCTTQLTGAYMWVTLGPVKDYDSLLRKIDFGKVTTHNPGSRLIYIESGR